MKKSDRFMTWIDTYYPELILLEQYEDEDSWDILFAVGEDDSLKVKYHADGHYHYAICCSWGANYVPCKGMKEVYGALKMLMEGFNGY